MNKKILKDYMLAFPGSFVGFFEVLADVLGTLGVDWLESGEKVWGETFIECGVQCGNIAVTLTKLRDDFDRKFSETDPAALVEQHLEKVKNVAK